MNKKTLTILILSVTSIIMASGVVIFSVFSAEDASASDISGLPAVSGSAVTEDIRNNSSPYITDIPTYIPPVIEGITPTPTPIPEEPFIPATELDLEPNSITVFVNKEYALPKGYKPDDLVTPNIYFHLNYYDERTLMRAEAAAAIEQLFLAARIEGYELGGVSGYRSYARQYKIFTNNIVVKGKEHTLRYSAVPGTSEHQTGLTMDISCAALRYDLTTAFANTAEGKWVAENAHLYGFTIRYPKGKTKITGYAYEPWHIRYVGKPLAKYLYENDLTLEEYYNYTPSKDFDFEATYADLINYVPSVTPLPDEGVMLGEDGEIIEIPPGEELEVPVEDPDAEASEDTDDNTAEDDPDTEDGSDIEGDSNSEDASDEDGSGTEDGSASEDDTDPDNPSGPDDSSEDGTGNDVSGDNPDGSGDTANSSGNGPTDGPGSGSETGLTPPLSPSPTPPYHN